MPCAVRHRLCASWGVECRCLGKIGGSVQWEIVSKEQVTSSSPASPDVLQINGREEDIRTFRTSKQTLFRDEVEQAGAQVVATDYEEF
ncbi:hypothetical protein D3C84_314350 [compost metagenome]